MVKVSESIQQDIKKIKEKLKKLELDPTPKIFLICGAPESPYSEIHRSLVSLPKIKEIKNIQELKDVDLDPHINERILYYLNGYENSFEDLQEIITRCHYVIKESDKIIPLILISEQDFTHIMKVIDEKLIPSNLFCRYKLGKVSKKNFEGWLKKQFPVHITSQGAKILNEGINNDFSKLMVIRDIFFEKESFKLSFVKEDNQLTQLAQFDGDKLTSKEGNKLSIPSNFFLFDTSAVVSELLPKFIQYAGSGKWIYPSFIRKEVHRLEEKGKRGGRVKPSHIKSNLDLLDKNFEIVKHSYPKARVKAENVDNRLVDVALETGAIMVTADKMVSRDCKMEEVPVVLFK